MYITVLDFQEGRVFQYHVEVRYEAVPKSEQIEDFLIGEGHRINDCAWMSHADGEIAEKIVELLGLKDEQNYEL
jgi:hypothetical protein